MRKTFIGIAAVLCAVLLAGCGAPSDSEQTPLPPGDAARGAALFTQTLDGAPACSTCHLVTGSSVSVGPNLAGFGQVAGTRVPGQTAETYARRSITQPGAHVVSGFANAMFNQYARYLDLQDIADLVAYMLTL